MSDPERDLVTVLLRERARDLYTAPVDVPKGLGRRVRRGQAFVVTTASILVVAVVAFSFVGLRALDRGGGGANPVGQLQLGQAFTTGGVSIPVPAGWQARSVRVPLPAYIGERAGPVAAWPVVQLTSFPVGSPGPFCPTGMRDAAAFPGTGVLLYVEEVF